MLTQSNQAGRWLKLTASFVWLVATNSWLCIHSPFPVLSLYDLCSASLLWRRLCVSCEAEDSC